MRKLFLTTTAILALGTTAAFAELSTQQIADMFPGAAKIEIKRGPDTTTVEVIMGAEKIEVVFDNATDAELKREVTPLTDTNSGGGLGGSDDDSDDDESDDDDDHDEDDDDDDHDDNDDDHGGHDSDEDHGDDDGDDD